MNANIIKFTFKGNPELAEAFATYKVGDKCSAKVVFQVDQNDQNAISGTIEMAGPYPEEQEAPEEAKSVDLAAVDAEGPMPAMLAVGATGEVSDETEKV